MSWVNQLIISKVYKVYMSHQLCCQSTLLPSVSGTRHSHGHYHIIKKLYCLYLLMNVFTRKDYTNSEVLN